MKLSEEIKHEIITCESGRLELCWNLHDEDIPELVEILQSRPSIQYLDLSSNKIGQAGVVCLSKLKHLIHLNLSNNNITNEAVQILLLNKNLISLNCSENSLLDNKLAGEIMNKATHHTSLKFNGTKISSNLLQKIEKRCASNREVRYR
jgi:Leucine-rich repeat (LRR) protein